MAKTTKTPKAAPVKQNSAEPTMAAIMKRRQEAGVLGMALMERSNNIIEGLGEAHEDLNGPTILIHIMDGMQDLFKGVLESHAVPLRATGAYQRLLFIAEGVENVGRALRRQRQDGVSSIHWAQHALKRLQSLMLDAAFSDKSIPSASRRRLRKAVESHAIEVK